MHGCGFRTALDLNRRDFLKVAAGAGAALMIPGCPPPIDDRGLFAATAILRAGYDTTLVNVLMAGMELVPPPEVAGISAATPSRRGLPCNAMPGRSSMPSI